jgi:L-threonylcarbamoyladenylate synthase
VIGEREAAAFERVIADGGIAVFPADTVYGLACHAGSAEAVQRLAALKGRSGGKAMAVMFFTVELALAAVPELGPRTTGVLRALLPGGLTALVSNPGQRFAPACGPDPGTLGIRVPALSGFLAALQVVRTPVAQSSANAAGGADARTLAAVPEAIRRAADLVLDGGELPGTPSTVVDLRAYEAAGEWVVLRDGAVPRAQIAAVLD